MTSIALIEDHHLVRDGFERLFASRPNTTVTWSGADLDDFISALDAAGISADIALVDVDLNGSMVDTNQIRQLCDRGVAVIIVSALAQRSSVRALVRAGAVGLVAKNETQDQLIEAVETVAEGNPWVPQDMAAALADAPESERPMLSAREEEVLALYASGAKIATVARRLNLSPHTVKDYLKRIRTKFASVGAPAPTQLDLHRHAARLGFLE
ncbi:MAG: response regulator transcription factor [Candidatus Nanopelagicales bacterium]